MGAIPPNQIVALAGVFVAVALVAGLAASRLLSPLAPEQRRLRQVVERPKVTQRPRLMKPLIVDAGTGQVGLPRWLPKSFWDMSHVEKRLVRAGYRPGHAAVVFTLAQVLVPVALALPCLAWLGWTNQSGWTSAGLAGIVGYLLPGLFIDRRMAERRKQIRNGLPDVLDLIVVCLEAGSSLDSAVVKASDELALAYPALAEELRIFTTETRAGKPRIEAFRNLAHRTGVEDVRALVAMLVQTDRFGTSVAQALRTLADDMRTRRRQMAEEIADKVGVKLVFPLVLCLFPAFFIVILGPAVIKMMRAFSQVGR